MKPNNYVSKAENKLIKSDKWILVDHIIKTLRQWNDRVNFVTWEIDSETKERVKNILWDLWCSDIEMKEGCEDHDRYVDVWIKISFQIGKKLRKSLEHIL